MSPRIKILRKVLNPPIIKGFKPYGRDFHSNNHKMIEILFEEYEALRLCDYDMYNHHQSSVIMGVSRPTFTRIYSSARRKIAKAFVEGLQIVIEGGKVYFDSDWYVCHNCKCNFNNPEREKPITNCPLCNSNNIINFENNEELVDENRNFCFNICICPECGIEQVLNKRQRCNNQICPECSSIMIRKIN